MELVSITKTARTYPRLPYQELKNDILGDTYALSLVFIGSDRARTLNQETRGKEYVPNVLSFPLTNTAGEIYITPTQAKLEAPKFGLTTDGYIAYLYIHGLLHLKGHDHGDEMDTHEATYMKRYGFDKRYKLKG